MRHFSRWITAVLAMAVMAGCTTVPDRSEESNPAELNLQLGMGYLQSGQLDVAEEKLERALEYDDSLAEAHNAIAVLYEETDRDQLAGTHYRRAIDLKSDYTVARINYGRFLCNSGQPREGERQYLIAAKDTNYPSPAALYEGAAVCALMIPDRELAETYLQQAQALTPNAPQVLYRLADLSYARGDYRQAQSYLQRYHAKASYNPESLWLAMSIETGLGNQRQRRMYADLLTSRFADSEQAKRLR